MKHFLRLTLLAAAILVAGTAASNAQQRFGFIDTREVIDVMPEMATVTEQLQAYEDELMGMLEAIQVEHNNKYLEYQKGVATYSDSVRQLKEKELQDLQVRFSEFQQTAQQDMQTMQNRLLTPVFEKARTAIEAVAQVQQLAAVFDLSAGALVYHDPSSMMDLLPLVKTELGIVD